MAEFKGRGFRIHYVEQGRGSPVVFAHGYLMDHTMWAPQFEDVPDHHRCLAWDMRGHGSSECPPAPWSLQDVVVDLVQFIEAVGAAPCHLVGMSMGGMLAARVALQREDLVRSLVLVDTTLEPEDPERAAQYAVFASMIEADGVTPELVDMTLPLFFGDDYRRSNPEAVAIHVARVRGMRPEAVATGMRAVYERESVLDRAGEIRVPTLVVQGEEDRVFSMEQAERMAKAVAGARLVRVPRAGHTPPLEAPDEVNAALGEFLAGLR